MTVIFPAAPSIVNSLAQLISSGSGGLPAPTATSANSTASAPISQGNVGPATFVTLSDQAKAAAAARAQSEQAAADSLQAYVEAHSVNRAANGTQTSAVGSLQSLLGTSTQPTGTQPTSAQPTSGGSKVEAIVAQISALADASQPQPFQPFTPTKNLSNSVTYDGYTLTLDTNARTQSYGIELSGNGVQAFNSHFGPSDGAGGTTAPAGVSVVAGTPGNNGAEDAVTITQNLATASSASVSSSGGSASASAVNAQSSSITFLVNYATGQISVQQSLVSVSAKSTQSASPASTLSTLA